MTRTRTLKPLATAIRTELLRRRRISTALKRLWRSRSRHQHIAAAMRRQWQDPHYRQLRVEHMKGHWRNPATRRRMSAASTRRWRDSVHRRKLVRALTKAWQNPARRAARCAVSRRNLGPSVGAFALQSALGNGWLLECWTPAGPIDVAHPTMRLAIEVDDVSHRRPTKQRRDRQKERQLRRLGWTVFRVSEAACHLLRGNRENH
jgi:hypothetical protein